MVGSAAAVRSFLRSTSVRSAAGKLSSAAKTPTIRSSAPKPHPHRIFRCPVELSVCLETVQPFCSVTVPPLMTSTFVLSCRSYYGCLPEGS
ncbi:hypothetical protein M8C21_000603 [Ambrosia artemisiifolia]|uniref:Uncharacterized protein n=1 Tax=Ambrosia artemisiifolia TaxID=4212 RepID=A0AAD5GHR8_AMBAR|nr:hypothetical protein M8C21_000603 [Ambrosia artemisiifolia]